MTLKQFLDEGLQFGHHLTAHHTIEERYFFPMLARRMPEFDPRRGDLIDQHRQIHEGLEVFEAYLRGCRSREHELDLAVLREKMESWGDILWTHLDQEVKTLGADNMRRYWSKDDMAQMNM
jgi:hemerythrin-like domain-containing protein